MFFFEISNGNRYCVFDSTVNPTTMERVVNVFIMQGALCSVQISQDNAVITVQNDEKSDCKWNGETCAPVDEGLRTTFSLDAPDFDVVAVVDPKYKNSGGKVVIGHDAKQFYTLIESPIADLYVNISTIDGKSWCLISSECTPDNWKPVSILYASQNAVCSTREISYHHFRISAKVQV